ncbi:MAG: RraA family protein [Comamonadaceae bacterium]|nr:MAG: RraA family protein [Comamonadaceae bacterium]
MSLTQPGLRIKTDFERVDPALVERARKIPVAVIGDVAKRLQCFSAGFVQYGGRKKFVGPALTVKVRPGDNLMLHKAIDLAQPGDVLVIDAGGALNTATFGAMMSSYAVTRGIAAFVLDGAIRDVEEISHLDFGVVARGATPNGPFKTGPGEIGYPISCGGISVPPGDLIAADMDGVLVVPRADAASLMAQAEDVAALELTWEKAIAAGTWPRGWVDEALQKL